MVEAVHRMRVLKLEPKRLRMVHSNPGSRGEFVLVEGVKGGGEELAVLAPLYIYKEEGGYSDELEIMLSGISAPAE
jgi:tRNA1Val (adenine37-N6)-methyltransferase